MDTIDQTAEPCQLQLGGAPAAVPEHEWRLFDGDFEFDAWNLVDDASQDLIISNGCNDPLTHAVEPLAARRQMVISDTQGTHVLDRDDMTSFVVNSQEELMPKPYEPVVFDWPRYTLGDVASWNDFVPDLSSVQPNAPDINAPYKPVDYYSEADMDAGALGGKVQTSPNQNREDDLIAISGGIVSAETMPNFGQHNDFNHDFILDEHLITKIEASPKPRQGGSKREKCKGQEGSKCAVCIRNHDTLKKHSLRLCKPSMNHIEIGPIKLSTVAFYEINEMHSLLVKIRAEIDNLSGASKSVTLEAMFKGNLVCHIADGNVNPYSVSRSAVPVAILELSTTSTARRKAKALHVAPALNAQQLDSFIDTKAPPGIFSKLRKSDIQILNCALRSAYYFGILFNWTSNMILYDTIDLDRHAREAFSSGLQLAKNLVLETLYSIVHRIDCLIRQLFEWVDQSLKHHGNTILDPATISCALAILYSSVNKFRKLDWSSIHVKDLRDFLDGLRDRSKVALISVQHYNWMVGYKCCGQRSSYLTEFVDLVEKAKTPSFVVSFAYERHYENDFFMKLHGLGGNPTTRLSYVDVLEQRYSWIEQLGNEALGSYGDTARWLTRSSTYESALKYGAAEDLGTTQRLTKTNLSQLTGISKAAECEGVYGPGSVTSGKIDLFANLSTTPFDKNGASVWDDEAGLKRARKRQASSSLRSNVSHSSEESNPQEGLMIMASSKKRTKMSSEAATSTPFLGSCTKFGKDMFQSVFQKLVGN